MNCTIKTQSVKEIINEMGGIGEYQPNKPETITQKIADMFVSHVEEILQRHGFSRSNENLSAIYEKKTNLGKTSISIPTPVGGKLFQIAMRFDDVNLAKLYVNCDVNSGIYDIATTSVEKELSVFQNMLDFCDNALVSQIV